MAAYGWTPLGGCTGELGKEALVVVRQAAQVVSGALAVFALELQQQLRVLIEGGDSRRHAAGEGDPGHARDIWAQKSRQLESGRLTGLKGKHQDASQS